MRFRKGEIVEVMNKDEAPVSWRVAEILSVDGPTSYHVKHDTGMAGERIVERISRKFVRPCPPLVEGMGSCVAGDVVEVFYECSWKIAAVLKVLDCKKRENRRSKTRRHAAVQNQYLVRLLGSSQELVTDMLNIRMRQIWRDGEWILMGKNSRGGENVLGYQPSTSSCYQKMNFQNSQFNARAKRPAKQDYLKIQDGAEFWDSAMVSSRSLKRMSPYGSSIVEASDENIKKSRAVGKDGKKQKVFATTPVLEKVDAAAYPRKFLGEQNMHFSFISNGYNQMEGGNLNYGCFGVRSSDISSSDSDACSVDSCSVNSHSPNNIPFVPFPYQETDILSSDAESCCGSGLERKCSSFLPEEKIEVGVHRLELHAYRSTLEALYASGPLSWEQEALLTNLRITLRISNDEHLIELKQLISSNTTINV